MHKYDPRFSEYYNLGSYRDFKKLRAYTDKLSHTTHLVFTNGRKEVFASGCFTEEALSKIFDRIDKYYTKLQLTTNCSTKNLGADISTGLA